jgi:hypothetical protein
MNPERFTAINSENAMRLGLKTRARCYSIKHSR